jgi:hypothetical protein
MCLLVAMNATVLSQQCGARPMLIKKMSVTSRPQIYPNPIRLLKSNGAHSKAALIVDR